MGAFYTVAQLPVEDTEKFCAWCLKEFYWKDEKTPEGKIGETIMMAPAAGFYSTQGMGMNQVRLAYVLNKKDIQRALFLLEKALEQYEDR
jgi:aspartate aminotransferase